MKKLSAVLAIILAFAGCAHAADITLTVTQNLMLRRDPDPLSPSVLEGLYPDYIPAGQHFSFKLPHGCTRIDSGNIWCPLTYKTSDGQMRKGWVNAYYVALNSGTRLACELDGSNSQIPECHIDPRAPMTPLAGPPEDWQAAYNRGDYATALRLIKPLATQGNAYAQNNLGFMYHEGHGVAKDYKEAVKWYRLAAEQGNADAQTNLGGAYQNGFGVPKDYGEAVK
jgi:Sel1 repeat